MSASWMTKYGRRRVRVDLPTLEDALFAAEGLTADKTQQIQIAAELMQRPVDDIKTEAERIISSRGVSSFARGRRSPTPVVVERRTIRRPLREAVR